MTFEIFEKSFMLALNHSLNQAISRDKDKIASTVSFNKSTPNKHNILNYKPVSFSNSISKTYKNAIKEKLASYIKLYSSLIISPHKKTVWYSTRPKPFFKLFFYSNKYLN